MFQLLFDSIERQVIVPENVQKLFMLILNQLEKHQQNENNESKGNNNENTTNDIENNPINIISYYRSMNESYPNNISKIKITAGNNEGQYDINNLFRYDTLNICDFYYKFFSHKKTNDTLERYIEFEFKEDQIRIKSCKVETNDFYYNQRGMKIVGSNDHFKWDTLYECADPSQLIDGIKEFQCQHTNDYYRIIRYIEIDNIDHSDSGLTKMEIKRIDFQGFISSRINNANHNESDNTEEILTYSDLFSIN